MKKIMENMFMDKQDVIAKTGIKILVYGASNAGKSTFSGTFPKINLVDSEQGQNFYLEGNPNIIKVLPTQSFSQVQKAMEILSNPKFISEFDTIVIDSKTKLYENMKDTAEAMVKKKAIRAKAKDPSKDIEDINLSPREYGHIKRWNSTLNNMFLLLSSLGKITVITAHQKDIVKETKVGDKVVTEVIGYAPDLHKKENYDYDIVLRLFTEKDMVTGKILHKAEIIKDRVISENTGKTIDNPSYEIWREVFEKMSSREKVMAINFNKDVEESVNDLEDETIKIEESISAIKEFVKGATEADRNKVTNLMREEGITALNTEVGMDKYKKIIGLISELKG